MLVTVLGCAAACSLGGSTSIASTVDDPGTRPPAALVALLDGSRGAFPASNEILTAAGDVQVVLGALAACQPGAETRYPWGAEWGATEARALVGALLVPPVEEVRAAARAAAARSRPDALAAISVHGALGTWASMMDIAAASRSLDWDADDRHAALVLGAAVAAIVPGPEGDTPDDVRSFMRAWSAFDAGARPVALGGVAAANEALGFRVAAALLPFEHGQEVALLSIIHSSAAAAPTAERSAAAAAVREHLSDDHPSAACAAARAAGALADEGAVVALVGLLGASDEALRRAAHSALRIITGRGFPLDAAPWRRWLADEERWWASVDRLHGVLGAGSPAAAAGALREIALRSTRPEERARLAALALDHATFTVRIQACGVLGRIRVDAAVEALEFASADDSDVRVRAAASRALGQLDEAR